MKKTYSIIRNILAIIGGLAIIAGIVIWIIEPKYDVYIDKNNYGLLNKRLELLRTSGEYAADTNVFEMKIVQDEVRAKEIRVYFQLDTLYPENATTWEKAVAIGKFVSTNIPHANQKEWPKHVNAIGLWEYTKDVEPAFNCRLHSIMTFELLLAADIKARYITCMPEDKYDQDCHVVNEVWLPELNKWAMVDTDMGGHYVTDKNGTPLSLKDMREHYISGEKMVMHYAFGEGSSKGDDYYAYMAKNTYWFSCWGSLSYYQEDYKVEGIDRNSYVNLIPSGYTPYGIDEGDIVTTNAELFWEASLLDTQPENIEEAE
ncbi:MAG: transglutaminase domain-containing protein [Bacteroidales bacterium]|nr:transglutaminase domain-containing protein [Bacteroidales bacterium]